MRKQLIIGIILVSLATVTVVNAATKRLAIPSNVDVIVNGAGKVVVTWDGSQHAKRYHIRLYQHGALLKRDTVSTERKRFSADYFDEGEGYRIWIRAKATDTRRRSYWQKYSYVHPTTGSNEDSITNDAIYMATSSTTSSFTDAVTATFTAASVPDAVRLTVSSAAGNANDVLVYYVDLSNYATNGDEEIAMSRSTDNGVTWSEPATVTISGFNVTGEVPVDPSIVQLTDGSLRMYFYGFPYTSNIEDSSNSTIYSATSTDGENFTVESGTRFQATSMTDPEVIYFNSQWLLYYNVGQSTGIATSSDGLTFATSSTWEEAGVPSAYTDNSTVYLYGCGLQGIHLETSVDGITFANNSSSVLMGPPGYTICDPSVISLANGQYLLVYKKRLTE